MQLTKLPFLRTLASTALAFTLAAPAAVFAQTSAAVGPTTVASRLTRPIDESSRVTLSGTVHPLAQAANDRGVAADGMQLDRLQIVLKRSDAQESALKQLLSDLHTPGSASYHKWLTPDQFGQQFGPSDADVATLETWLGSHGFGSMKLSPGRQTLEFSGSVAQLRDTFHTQVHKYQVNGETHYANSTDPQIPAAVAPVVGGFASLNNFRLRSYSKTLGKATYNPRSHETKPQWTVGNSQGVSFILAPGDFAVQYDLNPLYKAGTTGSGQSIAIIDESNINVALVNNFRTLFGLSANPPNVIIDGNDPGIDGINNPGGPNGASGEAYLDVEWAGAVAPAATIDLVIAADTALETGLFLAAQHAVYANIAPIISLSFGGCEAAQGSFNQIISALWEQAAAQGITVLVSSGDSGSAGCDNDQTQNYAFQGQAVNGLASTPYNVAVGGTDFFYSAYNQGSTAITTQLGTYWANANGQLTTSNSTPAVSLLTRIPEQPWNDSQYGLNIFPYTSGATTISAGGGGASTVGFPTTTTTFGPYPKPAWQTGAGVPTDGARDLPDVSLFASDNGNGSFYPICAADGDCQPVASGSTVQITGVGGTSVSAPAFAGMIALVDQINGPQGQADFVLYPLATQYPSAFHDVVSGTNSVPCNITPIAITGVASPNCIAVANPITGADPNLGTATEGQIGNTTTNVAEYNAGVGYDLATGLGTIDANVMVTNWNKVKFTTSTTTLTASPTTFTHGTAVTISGAVTGAGTPTGSVALMTDSPLPLQVGQAAPIFQTGQTSVFALKNGSYQGNVNYLPGGTYNIWGQYSGDGTNAASTSNKVSITVSPENSSLYFNLLNSAATATQTAAIAAGGTVPYGTQLLLAGQAVPTTYYTTCLTVTTPPATCNTTTFSYPTGTVTFTDSGSAINTATVNSEGDAEFNAPFTVGTHSVAASYSGDKSYNPSTAAAFGFTVAKDTPQILFSSTAATSAANTYQGGQPITFTIGVENYTNAANTIRYQVGFYSPVAPPTGTVTLSGLPAGVPTSATLQGTLNTNSFAEGVATITAPSTLAAGTYNVTISYPGDANYNATTATGTVIIAAANNALSPSTTTVTSSATTTSVSAAVNVTATVTGATGKAAPTGTVLFSSSGVSLGSVQLSAGSGDVSSVTIQLNSALLLPGANLITAQYSGDTVYQPSSATFTITNGPSFALSGAAVSATRGTAATSTITVTPTGGFTGSVALSCAVTASPAGATNPPTCSVSTPAAITGTTAVTATLTVNTTAPTTAKLENPLNRIFTLGGGVALAALLFFGLPVQRRGLKALLSLLVFAILAGAAAGCGGGTTTPVTTPPVGGTTTGSYTVSVTGIGTNSSSSGSVSLGPVTQTAAVALTVN
ncbi:MAG TPA: Ig-like domain repeat protein [Granulicella sp.]|nr:Ig-like domain repeat protein [Granulicella sp.]